MPSFKQDFEKDVNSVMQTGGPSDHSHEIEDMEAGVKKKGKAFEEAEEDYEMSEEKTLPPRFSTLFGPPAPTPAQQLQRDDYSPPRERRRGGLFVSWPIIILVLATVVIETLIIFAYTVIGLYNNAPAGVFPVSAGVTACHCSQKQPFVNIAPNFVLPQAAQPVVETVTVLRGGALPDELTTSISTLTTATTVSSISTTTASVDGSSQAAAMASDVMSMLGSLTSKSTSDSPTTTTSTSSTTTSSKITSPTPDPGAATSTKLITVGPTQNTDTRTTIITVDPSGNAVSPRPTVTRTDFIDPSSSDAAKSSITSGAVASPAILPTSGATTTVSKAAQDTQAAAVESSSSTSDATDAAKGIIFGSFPSITLTVKPSTGTTSTVQSSSDDIRSTTVAL